MSQKLLKKYIYDLLKKQKLLVAFSMYATFCSVLTG